MGLDIATTDEGVAKDSVHDRLVTFLSGEDAAKASLPKAEDDEQPVEDAEPTDEIDGEAVEDSDTDVTDDEGDEEAGDGGDESRWMPETLADLAEALEVEPDELKAALKVDIKVDGQQSRATLADVVKSYQLEQHLHQRSQQMAEQRKEWEAEQERLRSEYQTKAQEADDTISAMEQLLANEYQGINWSELQEEDPTQFLLVQQQLQNKFAQIQQYRNALKAKRDQELAQQQSKLVEQHDKFKKDQMELLVGRIPEWADEEKRSKGRAEVNEYLKSLGATGLCAGLQGNALRPYAKAG